MPPSTTVSFIFDKIYFLTWVIMERSNHFENIPTTKLTDQKLETFLLISFNAMTYSMVMCIILVGRIFYKLPYWLWDKKLFKKNFKNFHCIYLAVFMFHF